MPCFFLYFENIVKENKFAFDNMLHFIAPTLFVVIFISKNLVPNDNEVVVRKIFFLVLTLFYLFYAYRGYKLLMNNVWRRKSEIKAIQNQNRLIKNWTILLYVSFILIMVIRFSTGYLLNKYYINNNQYLWITALIWSGIFVKIMLTPEILYGYNFLNKTIDTVIEKVALHTVWKTDGTLSPIVSEKDKKMEEKISAVLNEYVHKIEEFSFRSEAFRNPDLSLEDIAAAIKIPVSHIQYIFKFHCTESFTDYKKIVRIHDATKLLENGYLREKTVESLSETVGFSSYVTFYLAFKSITGMTTQEYAKRY
jgi:AraC-like DNA-binding protein